MRASLGSDVARDEGGVGSELFGRRWVLDLVLLDRLCGGLEESSLGAFELRASLVASLVHVGEVSKSAAWRFSDGRDEEGRRGTNRTSQTRLTPPGRTLQNLVRDSVLRYSFATPVTRTVLDWARRECSLEMRKSWRRTTKAANSRLRR